MTQDNSAHTNCLDSLEKIQAIDKQNVLGSIKALADQVRQAWQETQSLEIKLATAPSNITVAGMGGSAIGADVVKHAYKNELTVPFNIVNDYELPGYINKNSLVILSSYSGNTEEILSCAQQAKEKKAQVLVITQGGKLTELAKKNNYQGYIIKPDHNPSDQPRMAIGYAVVGLLGLLNKAGLIKINNNEIEEVIAVILAQMCLCSVEQPVEENPAKTIAYTLVDRRPNLVASEFLTGATHVACNQFNENSKTFANYYQVPEINHHLLEGLKLPFSNKNDNFFIFFNSQLYHLKNQKRISLTQEAVDKYEIETMQIELKTQAKLYQIFELITLMAYATFYLSILNKINPSEVPMVDWFKKKLTE